MRQSKSSKTSQYTFCNEVSGVLQNVMKTAIVRLYIEAQELPQAAQGSEIKSGQSFWESLDPMADTPQSKYIFCVTTQNRARLSSFP